MAATLRAGIISDTHGLLRPEACAALAGCDRIIHAGDIGNPDILATLAMLAPVTAVRGNNDRGKWARGIAEEQLVQVGGITLCVLHDLARLPIDVATRGIRVVVSGHSHRPVVREHEGVLYVNPGSAGPRRFRLPVAVAELTIHGDWVRARIIELSIRDAVTTRAPTDRRAIGRSGAI
jgi:putative phosphoesterase